MIGHVRFSSNLYFLAYFFSRNSVFLSQQISRNSVSACFFSEAKRADIFKYNGTENESNLGKYNGT